MKRVLPVPERYELRATLGPLRLGGGDRTVRVTGDEVWRATRTPQGPATGRYRGRPGEGRVVVDAWGPGGAWLLEHAGDLLGLADDTGSFADVAASHPVVARLARERPGVRMPRSGAVYEALLPAVLAQKVTGHEAKQAWRWLVGRWGEPAPVPLAGLLLPPAPAVLADVPYHALHPLGVERRRAEVLRAVARSAAALDRVATRQRMEAIPGIGPWTSAEVARVALGDADAVSVGDYHLPNTVAWALAGEPRGDDARMLELLAPFAGHRGRVCRLLELDGRFAPRRGPRLAPGTWLRPRSA